jgi:ABC-type phosphate/phosphonate transport system permease subunit
VSQAESLKEAIGWLKVVFGLLVAVDISLIGWLAQNYGKAQIGLLIIAWAATMAATVAIILAYLAAYRHINNLKDV